MELNLNQVRTATHVKKELEQKRVISVKVFCVVCRGTVKHFELGNGYAETCWGGERIKNRYMGPCDVCERIAKNISKIYSSIRQGEKNNDIF